MDGIVLVVAVGRRRVAVAVLVGRAAAPAAVVAVRLQ
jgi:hypothetical protein